MKIGCYYRISGVVQGVGFRYFVYQLARSEEITGDVRNFENDVVIHAYGEEKTLDHFCRKLQTEYPSMARVAHIEIKSIEWKSVDRFSILETIL